MRSALTLLGFLILCFAVGLLGGFFTSTTVRSWYPTLVKPTWTPSGRTIGIVWNILYLLMAIAAWLVYTRAGFSKTTTLAFTLFVIQLALNLLWSVIFFGIKSPGLAFLELLVLEAFVLATLIAFFQIWFLPAVLLIPYAAWVAFAGVLNFLIWRSNT